MNRVIAILGYVVLVLVGTVAAVGAPAPAAQPAQPVTATVKTVEGTVESRAAGGQPWTPVNVGQALAEGTDLRTGFRARCVLEMPQSVVQIDPLTVIRIGELKREGNTLRTRIYLKQGNTESAVDRGGANNEFSVETPSASLSVRGTKGIKCGFFPDRGGEYGLTAAGLLALYNNWLHNHTDLHPGENSDDHAKFPIWFLAMQFEPSILDQFAFDDIEKWAAMRWHTSLPFPAGLGGGSGIGPITGIQGDNQTPPPPSGNSSDEETIIIIVTGGGTSPLSEAARSAPDEPKKKHGNKKP